jgi:gas vesicle protein
MASGNPNRPHGQGQGQGRDQGQGQHNGGTFQNARDQAQQVGQRLQERAGEMGDRLQEHAYRARDEMAHHYRHAEGAMARNPMPSVLIGFGIGFGLGLALTAMLAAPEETWAERNLPESWYRLPKKLRYLAESGREMAEDLAESVRGVPEAVSSRIPRRFRG